MTIRIGSDSFAALTKEIGGDLALAATAAMRAATPDTTRELRDQVTSSGLGQRLANTWRGRVYPERRQSLNPTGYVWSNAPDIVDAFIRGATIVPVAGSRFLAIPTDAVPKQRGGRGQKKQMTPAEVEREFGQKLFHQRGKSGRVLAFLNKKGRGAKLKRVLMFVLVPAVRLPKLLDLDGPAERWTRRFETEFAARVEDR